MNQELYYVHRFFELATCTFTLWIAYLPTKFRLSMLSLRDWGDSEVPQRLDLEHHLNHAMGSFTHTSDDWPRRA